jgi:hypothetical protein
MTMRDGLGCGPVLGEAAVHDMRDQGYWCRMEALTPGIRLSQSISILQPTPQSISCVNTRKPVLLSNGEFHRAVSTSLSLHFSEPK